MDDRKIRSLLTVLETGSISSAAERLNGTEPRCYTDRVRCEDPADSAASG